MEKNSTKPTAKTLVTITRRSAIIIVAIAAVAVLVGASVLSNYLVPSTVNVTSQPGKLFQPFIHKKGHGKPGVTVYPFDSVANACSTTPVTTFSIGDVQQSQSKQFASVCIKNTGGSATAYVLDLFSVSSVHITSLTTQPNPMPSGVTLTWNFNSVAAGTSNAGCPGFTGNGNCIGLSPGQSTPAIALTLSVTTSAATGVLSFTTEFDTFTSQTG